MVRIAQVLTVVTEAKGLFKKFTDIEYFLTMKIPQLTKEQAKAGADFASSIAPRRSGALIQAIGSEKKTYKKQGVSYQVISRKPQNINNNNPRGVPYHAYLNNGRTVTIRNGRTQKYMDVTAKWLNIKYPELLKKELNRTIQK